jgi:hypothetical protein
VRYPTTYQLQCVDFWQFVGSPSSAKFLNIENRLECAYDGLHKVCKVAELQSCNSSIHSSHLCLARFLRILPLIASQYSMQTRKSTTNKTKLRTSTTQKKTCASKQGAVAMQTSSVVSKKSQASITRNQALPDRNSHLEDELNSLKSTYSPPPGFADDVMLHATIHRATKGSKSFV